MVAACEDIRGKRDTGSVVGSAPGKLVVIVVNMSDEKKTDGGM